MAGRRNLAPVGILLTVLLAGCTSTTPDAARQSPDSRSARESEPTPTPTRAPSSSASSSARGSPSQSASPSPSVAATFDARAAMRDIVALADDIGPREATSEAFREAADLVADRFEEYGYTVSTERVEAPAGNSWGTRVRAGASRNVVADPPGFDPSDPHVVVVAHLDTVPVAPGAEDNASGVSVLMELVRLAAAAPQDVPARFIAFGAEEPRGDGDTMHHFGSRQHVSGLTGAERDAILGVVALDRVGVRSRSVPVCSARESGNRLRAAVRAAGRDADVPTHACSGNTTSDHWSYAKAGIPAIRLGSVPYAGYHSAQDTPDVIDRRQLDRVGQVMWAWLRSLE